MARCRPEVVSPSRPLIFDSGRVGTLNVLDGGVPHEGRSPEKFQINKDDNLICGWMTRFVQRQGLARTRLSTVIGRFPALSCRRCHAIAFVM
jgi:hypothetical protein